MPIRVNTYFAFFLIFFTLTATILTLYLLRMNANVYKSVLRWENELDGVFSMQDLRVILGDKTEAALYKRIEALINDGTLLKVKRGIYATPQASLAAISNKINPDAYISTGTVLAQKALIGSVPARKLQAVKTGRPRTYRFSTGIIEHLSIIPKLYFGYTAVDGILYATPEKAFLDTCYYMYKGKAFSFDPATDVNIEDLDTELVSEYLKKYNQRFTRFVKKLLT